eukprot:313060-Rhodomonas_salina.2
MHQANRKSACKWAGFKTSHFGNAEVGAEMGQAINAAAGNAGPAQQDYLEDPEIEDVTAEEANASQYSGYQGIPDSPGPAGGVPRDVQQECEDPKNPGINDDSRLPDPISVWNELMETSSESEITPELLKKFHTCTDPDDQGDASRRTKVPERAKEPSGASGVYEHPELQTIHEYILKNKLSMDAGQGKNSSADFGATGLRLKPPSRLNFTVAVGGRASQKKEFSSPQFLDDRPDAAAMESDQPDRSADNFVSRNLSGPGDQEPEGFGHAEGEGRGQARSRRDLLSQDGSGLAT